MAADVLTTTTGGKAVSKGISAMTKAIKWQSQIKH
jgi:hypothetical protein